MPQAGMQQGALEGCQPAIAAHGFVVGDQFAEVLAHRNDSIGIDRIFWLNADSMRLAVLAFAAGVAALQLQAALPGVPVLAALAGLGVLPLAWRRLRPAIPLAALLLGFVWAGLLAQQRLADALPAAGEGRDMAVVGVVAGLPQRFENGLRFDFDIESSSLPAPSRVSLAWYGGVEDEEAGLRGSVPAIRAGERWRLTVRLKRPHGNLNPHGFDYEAWLFERGIRAAGYVRKADGNGRLDAFVPRAGYAVERLRQMVRDRFSRVLGEAPYAGILVALAVGDQRAIDAGV